VNKQRTNHKRHLIMKHSCRLDGTVATEVDIAQARAWSSKIPADQSQYYKSKEFVSSESDDDSDNDTPESSSSSRRDSPPPPRQHKKAKRDSSDSPPCQGSPRRSAPPSRSSSPSVSAPPKVRKVRFEVDEPVSERGESSRGRKRPAKEAQSAPKAAATVPSRLELELAAPEPRKFATAQRSKKAPVTVRSEVHTATKPPATKKKAAKSSEVFEVRGKTATPKKELVIETPRLDMMVQVAKQAVQNLKDRKELQIPDPSVYRHTYGPASKSPKPSQVKGKSKLTGKGKATVTVTTSAEGRSVTASTAVPAPMAETPVTATADMDIETQ